jgi:hypothetical protein
MGVWVGALHGRFTPHRGGLAWNRLALLIILGGVIHGRLELVSFVDDIAGV